MKHMSMVVDGASRNDICLMTFSELRKERKEKTTPSGVL